MFSGGCPAENSSIWVTLNLGEFSQFATLREMYQLNQDFNAVSLFYYISTTKTLCLTFSVLDELDFWLFSIFLCMLCTLMSVCFLCLFQIDALVVLSPKQTAELIVEDFAGLPEKSIIINMIFDHILVSPEDRGLLEMLGYLIVLAGEVRAYPPKTVCLWTDFSTYKRFAVN